MYLRLTHGRFDPAKYDEVMRLVPDLVAAIRQLPGCQGVQVGIDRDAGRTISVSTLDTLEQRHPGTAIDEVLLVGGATRMPAVAARLTGKFGWHPRLHDPDLAVAKGAAIFALSRVAHRRQEARRATGAGADEVVREVARRYELPATTVAELLDRRSVGVLPKAFGVRVLDTDDPGEQRQIVHHLAFANDPLPVLDRRFTARTVRHDQATVEVALYEQAGTVVSPELSANTPLTEGRGVIDGIPPQPPGRYARVDIAMSIDEDGLLMLHATEAETGRSLEIRVRVGLSDQEVDDAVAAVSTIAVSG